MRRGRPRRRSIGRSRARPTIAGGTKEAASEYEPPEVEAARRLDDLLAQPDEQRRGGARVQRDLEGLAQLGVQPR